VFTEDVQLEDEEDSNMDPTDATPDEIVHNPLAIGWAVDIRRMSLAPGSGEQGHVEPF